MDYSFVCCIHRQKQPCKQVQEQQAYILFYCRRPQKSHNIQSIQKILSMGNENDKTVEISRYWFHKMMSFSSVSPIDNLWLSCYHGHPLPSNHDRRNICGAKITTKAWNILTEKFGTSYNCSLLEIQNKSNTNDNDNGKHWIHLRNCIDCRRDYEKQEIKRLEPEERIEDCVISMDWASKWCEFVHGRSDEIPGCLDNRALDNNDGFTKPGLINNIDFLLVPTPIWLFLVELCVFCFVFWFFV